MGEASRIGALAAVVWAARELGADRARVVRYGMSGDATGELRSVVGYATCAVSREA